MAMVIKLQATTGGTLHTLGTVEVQRQTRLDNPEDPYDEVHTYDVRRFKGFGNIPAQDAATVDHRYGDGAWTLAQKALAALKIEDRMPRSDT